MRIECINSTHTPPTFKTLLAIDVLVQLKYDGKFLELDGSPISHLEYIQCLLNLCFLLLDSLVRNFIYLFKLLS